MPDKNGREYVLRRVMRRAIRHGHRLGIQEPFLHEVALKVVEVMGAQYPELAERQAHIVKVTEQEEVRFRATIERGLHLLDAQFEEMKQGAVRVLDGRAAYKLYNTFGFPLDLTEVICEEHGYSVDQAGYDAALAEDRERSEFDAGGTAVESVYREALALVPGGQVAFTGYHKNRDSSELVAIVVDGQLVSDVQCAVQADGSPAPLDDIELVFARTPFYGESGGQAGDHGTISSYSGQLQVTDCQKPIGGLVVHRGSLRQGGFTVGDSADLFIDIPRREAIRRNHSATHLLHWALRQVLGAHAQQKGSLVTAERLRFDFTQGEAITKEQLTQIEDLVNERILSNAPIQTELLSIEEAKQRGAMMLFGEKYEANVRMLSMTESVELCGGTHARATGDIGFLKVIGEQGVAAGVRRITAATGAAAMELVRATERTLERAAEVVKASQVDLPSRLERMVAGQKELEKKIAQLEKKLLSGGGGGGIDAMLAQARDVNGVKVLSLRTEVTDRSGLRELAEQLRDKLGSSVVMVASEADGKVQMVLTVARGLTDKYQAGNLIRPLATLVGGSGGGRPDMAQAGGTEVAKLDQAVAALYTAFEPGQLRLM
jgi:alanyl-tRNA synthetase